MALIETSIKINASPEKIFSHVSSLDSLKNEYVVSVEADGPIKLGTKIKTKIKAMNGVENVITSEVIAYDRSISCSAPRLLLRRPHRTWSAPTSSKRMAVAPK